MPDRRYRVLKIYAALFLLLASKASPGVADQITLRVPIEFAVGKNAFLIHARINGKPALLVLDTGSPQTVLQPGILGIKPGDLVQGQRVAVGNDRGAHVAGREVELQVGDMTWKKWQVKVMDQSEALSAYLDNPDGVLGIDFLQEFSSVTLDLEGKTVTFSKPLGQGKRHWFGNLRQLNFAVHGSHYTLNDIELERVSGDSVEFATSDLSYRVRITFMETVLVSKGEPVDASKRELIHKWAESIPLVTEILKQGDTLGSLKPLIYTVIAPKDRPSLQLREQLTLLWSADPADKMAVGYTGFGPVMRLEGQLGDVQYRDLSITPNHSISRIMLQILYIRDGGRWMTLGAFVIASKANGEYEFYLVSRKLLDQIVISREEQGKQK